MKELREGACGSSEAFEVVDSAVRDDGRGNQMKLFARFHKLVGARGKSLIVVQKTVDSIGCGGKDWSSENMRFKWRGRETF